MKNNLLKDLMILFIIGILSLSIIITPAISFTSKNNDVLQVYNQSNQILQSDTTWWNEDWQYRKLITINCSLIDEDLEDFPILFHHTSSDFADHAQTDGDDFVFVSDDNSTQYNHEIECYNATSGELTAWINIPSLSSSNDTDFNVYYGNLLATNQENVSGTWNDGYAGVYHLNEGGTGTRYDSTYNNNDGTPLGYDGDEAIIDGMIGGADDFDGKNDHIEITDDSSLDITGEITISAWVKFKATTPSRYEIINKLYWYNDNINSGYLLKVEWDNKFLISVLNNNSEGLKDFSVLNNIWYYTVGTWNSTQLKLYVNGSLVGSPVNTTISSIGTNNENLFIASSTNDNYHWNGTLDEVRISNVARSTEWIKTSYDMVNNGNAFISVSSEEELDLEPPEIVDNTPNVAYTGEEFTFNATITDNVGISEAVLIYRFNNNSPQNADMINTMGDYWEATIFVDHTLGFIYYMFCVWDTWGNNNHTDLKNITIVDNDFPEIPDVNVDPLVQMSGGYVNVSAVVTDNIEVSDVFLYIEYPDSSVKNFSIFENRIGNTFYSYRKYDQDGVYTCHIWASDSSDNSNVSGDYEFEIVLGEPPDAPHINGQKEGKAGFSYAYDFSSTDPEGDELYYYIDWGDGNALEWIGPYDSGEVITINHTWYDVDNYKIKAKARDTKGLESDWGSLDVIMPKSFNFFAKLVNWLSDCFPNLFSILQFFFPALN